MAKFLFHFFLHFFLLCPILLFAQELSLSQDDFRIEQLTDGGFHLFIRAKASIGSVLLTESTRDPALKAANYAYRADEWNAVNGNEIRILDGRPIPQSAKIWSLIDSSVERHPQLGEAFHIFIPYILRYGYEGGRTGEVYVTDGTYFNIRTFALPYGDYRGAWQDNPYQLAVAAQEPQNGPSSGNFMKEAESSYSEISKEGGGAFLHAEGPEDLIARIKTILERERGKSVDLVICLDTTGSMKDEFAELRKTLVPMLRGLTADFTKFRIGMILYKDYYEEYMTRLVTFTQSVDMLQRTLNSIQIRGGRDIPEAVHEALYDGVTKFPWEAESRLVILVGDAPPHLRPRGKISKEMVYRAAAEQNVRLHTIILPQ
ncbi:MAG: VWA domain-containing protein [Treponema sp.]|jgi:hypothetical protein|nr:VWA domain-containing protein [Treponema sp.]